MKKEHWIEQKHKCGGNLRILASKKTGIICIICVGCTARWESSYWPIGKAMDFVDIKKEDGIKLSELP